MYNVNTQTITSPIEMGDIADALGENTLDLGELYTNKNVRLGSPRRPIACNRLLASGKDVEAYLQESNYGYSKFTDAVKSSKAEGSTKSFFDSLIAKGDISYWGASHPESGWCNMLFFDGYKSDAIQIGEGDMLYKLKGVTHHPQGKELYSGISLPYSESITTFTVSEDFKMNPGAMMIQGLKIRMTQSEFADDADAWRFVWNGYVSVDIHDEYDGWEDGVQIMIFSIDGDSSRMYQTWNDQYGNVIYMGVDDAYRPYVEITLVSTFTISSYPLADVFQYTVRSDRQTTTYKKDGVSTIYKANCKLSFISEGISTIEKDETNTTTGKYGFNYTQGKWTIGDVWREEKYGMDSPYYHLVQERGIIAEIILLVNILGINRSFVVAPLSNYRFGYVAFEQLGLTADEIRQITGIKVLTCWGYATEMIPNGIGLFSSADNYTIAALDKAYHYMEY